MLDNTEKKKRGRPKKQEKLSLENSASLEVQPSFEEDAFFTKDGILIFDMEGETPPSKGFDKNSKRKGKSSKNKNKKNLNNSINISVQSSPVQEFIPEVVNSDSFNKESLKIKAEVEADNILKKNAEYKDSITMRNALKNRYVVSDANHVWCSDWTIGHNNKLYILLNVDLSSRLIVSSLILERQPSTADVVLSLVRAIEHYGVQPKIFHSDTGGAYTGKQLESFLKEKGIQKSYREPGDSKFDNQVVESLNRKLWTRIEELGLFDTQANKTRFFKHQKNDINHIINCIIENINSDKPASWSEGNPKELYNRLTDHGYEYNIITDKKSQEATWVNYYKQYLIVAGQANALSENLSSTSKEDDGLLERMQSEFSSVGRLTDKNIVQLLERARHYRDLVEKMSVFFKTSFDSLNKSQTNTAALLKQFEEETQEARRIAFEKETNMAELVDNLTKEVRMLREQAEKKDKLSEERRQKRLKRNRKPLRDSITYEDFLNIMNRLKKNEDDDTIAVLRDRICITLLFLLGIRVAELKEFTLDAIRKFLDNNVIEITVGKSNSPVKQKLVPSEETRAIMTRHISQDIQALEKKTGISSFLCPLSREHITRRLNNHLRDYGKSVNKEITSHSFRISYVTRIVESYGIEVARQMVGHVNVSTTQNYSRSNLSLRARAGIANKVLKNIRLNGNQVPTLEMQDQAQDLLDSFD